MWSNLRPFKRPLLVLTWLWLATYPAAVAQVSWTSIYVNENNQIDLWTEHAKGCPCPWDPKDQSCACCVKDGGCHCGRDAVNRCTQCGLESHCSNMCNITFRAASLKEQSGRTFGQIKSPSFVGPDFCWYNFVPEPTQRVELQVYRLVSVGRWNGTSCEAGYLQLVDGLEPLPSGQDIQMCGANERYTPPVVLFADEGPATLIFSIQEQTLRSQFLAYFSFTAVNSTQSVGFQPRGGMRLQNTDCDWLYQDVSCQKPGSCVLASPGYPGLYPPNRQCKYHIRTTFINARVRIAFKALLLPHNQCSTDYVAVYQGSALTSPLLTTLCSNRKTVLEYSGPNLLIVFSTGPQVNPFNYNGFLATIDFRETTTSTESSVTLPAARTAAESVDSTAASSGAASKSGCELTVQGNNSRSGHFDTRELEWHSNCRMIFKGRPTDIVHVSFFNYRLRTAACRTVIEIIDGTRESKRTMKKICSPQTKHARDPSGKFLEQQTFISTGSVLTVLLRKPTQANDEFLDGAYLFHDEEIGGTLQPNTKCDVTYYGASSPSVGMIDSPGAQDVYWNIEGPLRCSQQFSPAANQSITITIQTLGRLSSQPYCQTQCGDGGCRCVSHGALRNTDHLLLIAPDREVACLCGDFSPDWLPVSVRSWSPITVRYSVANYMWHQKGFAFSAAYNFNTDAVCGHRTYTVHAGEITSKNFTSSDALNHFYHQSCTWTLDSNVERQLEVEVSSSQNRPCTAWNITIHVFNPAAEDHNLGDLLHTFCPREKHKTYSLPWKLNTVIVRVKALSRTPPQFKVKWKSQVVRANTRLGSPTPAPNAISSQPGLKPSVAGLFATLLLLGNRFSY